jgi:hypothetical protein
LAHLSFNESDLYGVDLVINEWRKDGSRVEIDKSTGNQGFVTISTDNWKTNDGSLAKIELHKLIGNKGLFGIKSKWVCRLFSCPSENQSKSIMHGCVTGRTVILALRTACFDIDYNFMSKSKLEDYE